LLYSTFQKKISIPNKNKGYRDFLAVGAIGRIDSLDKSWKIRPATVVLIRNLEGVISRIYQSFIIDSYE